MLYGMEIANNEWKLSTYKETDYLVFSKDSRMYPKIPAYCFKERLKLFGATGEYFYYVFSFQEKPRYIFVSKETVNFASVDLPDIRQDSEIALIVEGALYDIRTERFITFDKNEIFFRFVLYDAGVPHVIYDESQACYCIYTLSSRRAFRGQYIKTSCFEDPQFTSYIYKDAHTLELNCMRVIFYKDTKGKDSMLVIYDELVKEMIVKDVSFHDTIPTTSIVASDVEYFNIAYNDEDVNDFIVNEYGYFTNNHMVDGDALVVRVSEGDWKEYAFVRLSNGKVEFDPKATFFSYKKVENAPEKFFGHNLIEITWSRNDFENETAIMDFTNNVLYSLGEFQKESASA